MNFKHVHVKLDLTCAVLSVARTSYLSQNRITILISLLPYFLFLINTIVLPDASPATEVFIDILKYV